METGAEFFFYSTENGEENSTTQTRTLDVVTEVKSGNNTISYPYDNTGGRFLVLNKKVFQTASAVWFFVQRKSLSNILKAKNMKIIFFAFFILTPTVVVGVNLYNTNATEQNRKERRILMEDAQIILERHEQKLKSLERDISDLKAVQTEIRTMNETLVTLATELKHTNEHLARHEQKIDAIESQPRLRIQQITTAIIAAIAGGLITTIIGMLFK